MASGGQGTEDPIVKQLQEYTTYTYPPSGISYH